MGGITSIVPTCNFHAEKENENDNIREMISIADDKLLNNMKLEDAKINVSIYNNKMNNINLEKRVMKLEIEFENKNGLMIEKLNRIESTFNTKFDILLLNLNSKK